MFRRMILLALLALPATARADGVNIRILVLPIQGEAAPKWLDGAFLDELRKLEGYEPVRAEDAGLDAATRTCGEYRCAYKAAKRARMRQVMGGRVHSTARGHELTIVRVHLEGDSRKYAEAGAELPGLDEEEVRKALPRLIERVFKELPMGDTDEETDDEEEAPVKPRKKPRRPTATAPERTGSRGGPDIPFGSIGTAGVVTTVAVAGGFAAAFTVFAGLGVASVVSLVLALGPLRDTWYRNYPGLAGGIGVVILPIPVVVTFVLAMISGAVAALAVAARIAVARILSDDGDEPDPAPRNVAPDENGQEQPDPKAPVPPVTPVRWSGR